MNASLFEPGKNCWRVERAERVAFLIDGAAYFRALHAAITRAQSCIIIVNWEIDGAFELIRDGSEGRWPTRLCDLLNAVIRERRNLRVYVLDWDFAMINAPFAAFLPLYKAEWKTNRRLRFRMDDRHPLGASHHQKIVVIDDALAFSGGLDITRGRWDTPAHRPDDPRHTDRGRPGRPYHDVQMAVSGPAAAALGELARDRWLRATRQTIRPPVPCRENPWPAYLQPDLTDVPVAISRTAPRYLRYQEVREVERLYLDMIAAARRSIYIENQFFTAGRIAEALARRLEEDDGPEVVMALPLETDSWLSQATMDVMRARLIQRLRQADRHDRFRVYHDHIPGAALPVNLHAKVMVVDDELARVGSANLNNRSMGLDTECDLSVEARGDSRIAAVIAGFRDRLIAEHLDVRPERFAAETAARGSLIGAIDALRGEGRSLQPLPLPATPESDYLLSTEEMIDPERPIDPEEFMRQFVAGEDERPPARRRIAWWLALLFLVLGMAAAWRWTPLGEWLDTDTVLAAATQAKGMPATPLIVLAAYLVASLIALPITLLILVTMLAFGPWHGFAYAVAGCLLGAAAGYGAGHLLGRDAVRRLAGRRINELSRRIARRGLLAIVAVRFLPVAPFTVINLVAGASHIRLRDFVIGTAIGMTPGIAAIALFTDRIVASLEAPGAVNFVMLAVVIALITAAAYVASRWLRRRVSPASGSSAASRPAP